MKKQTILKKTVLGMTVLGMLLIVGTCAAAGFQFQKRSFQIYRDHAYAYTRLAVRLIDGDSIERYVATGRTDPYYNEILAFLNAAAEEAGIKYFYVIIPTEEDLIYVWDAEPGEEPLSFLEHDAYSEGGKENTMRVLRGEAGETFVIYRDEAMYVATAMTPLYNSSGDAVAVVAADISMPGVQEAFARLLIHLTLSILAIMFAAMLLYYKWVRRQIISPIRTLQKAAEELVDNIDKEVPTAIPVHTGDEFDLLARSYEDMAGKLKDYIRENEAVTAEKERIGAELEMAAGIQAHALPNLFPAFPNRAEFDIYATMDPAKEVGGDFYDFFMVDEDHLAMVVADVSGKGVPAALFMMIAKTMLKTQAQARLSPEQVLFEVNASLSENNKENMFVTVWLGILEISTGELTYADAGHEKLLLYQDGTWRFLSKEGGPALAAFTPEDLSFMDEKHRFRNCVLHLNPGDAIFQYTDGVTEATSAQNALFGDGRLLSAVNSASSAEPAELLPHVRAKIDEFVQNAPQFDDITMLALRIRDGSSKPKKAQIVPVESVSVPDDASGYSIDLSGIDFEEITLM